MSIEGQGHFFTIYFPGFVCFVLYLAKISGERLQDHWSSGFYEYGDVHVMYICEVFKFYTFESRHEKTCFFAYAKTKAHISCSVAAQVISTSVFAT